MIKAKFSLFILMALVAQVRADNVATPNATTPSGPIPATTTDAVVPTADFPASRYEALWKKSPFSVATAEGPTDTSAEYVLYGIANIDGITYASVIDPHNNEHFLISSDKPSRGLTLHGITRGPNGTDTYANVMKDDGQSLTLKLATAAATQPGVPQLTDANLGVPPPQPGMAPGSIVPNITAPSAGIGPGSARPFPRMHRPHITLPPQPMQPQAAPAPPPTPPPAPVQ